MSDSELNSEELAFQQWCDANRRPQDIPLNKQAIWLIKYQDKDIGDEIFAGEDAELIARRRFDQQRGSWSISLFKEVARA